MRHARWCPAKPRPHCRGLWVQVDVNQLTSQGNSVLVTARLASPDQAAAGRGAEEVCGGGEGGGRQAHGQREGRVYRRGGGGSGDVAAGRDA